MARLINRPTVRTTTPPQATAPVAVGLNLIQHAGGLGQPLSASVRVRPSQRRMKPETCFRLGPAGGKSARRSYDSHYWPLSHGDAAGCPQRPSGGVVCNVQQEPPLLSRFGGNGPAAARFLVSITGRDKRGEHTNESFSPTRLASERAHTRVTRLRYKTDQCKITAPPTHVSNRYILEEESRYPYAYIIMCRYIQA